MTEDQMFNMSDEELERAFLETRANEQYNDENDADDEIEIMEQPAEDVEEDSVDEDGATNQDENVTETDSEIETTEPDEVDEEIEEQLEEETEQIEETDEAQEEHQRLVFKANGREYEFSKDEIMSQFPKVFGQAMDYTKKTQAMKPWRKTIDAIEQAKLGHDDINLMIDVMKGDKNAIAEVLKRTGVDSLEIDTENAKYTPNDYGRDENALAIKDIVDEISVDKEYEITHRILSRDWDATSFNELTKDPKLIKALHIDVKTGDFNKVQAIAEKIKVFDGGSKSDLEYYKLASFELAEKQEEQLRRSYEAEQQRAAREARQAEVNRVKKAQEKQKEVVVKATERRAATPTSKVSAASKVVDYLDSTDEEFEEWYKQNVLDKI